MRLIDADAFAEFLKDTVKRQKYEDTKIDGLLTVADVIEAVISELDGTSFDGFKNAPTIEPDTDTISRQDAIEHLKKRLYESALNNEGVVSETMEEIADNRIQIWMDELPPSPSRQTEQHIHCNKCKHYQGVHGVQGHAPCSFWKSGGVLWNWYCSQAEPHRQ